MPPQPDLLTILPGELAANVPELSGKSVEVRPIGRAESYTFSQVTRWQVDAAGQPWRRIVIKEPHGEQASRSQAELEALQKLAGHFADAPNLRVPRALLALDDPPALVMEEVSGQRLNALMRGLRKPANEERMHSALAPIPLAGQWLSRLHRLIPPAYAQPLPSLADRVDAACTRLGETGISAAQIRNARAALPSLAGMDSPPHVILHGDYTLRNIIADPNGGVTVFDTSLAHTGPAAHDIGWFLAALAFIDRWQMLSRQWLYVRSALDFAHAAFVVGYKNAQIPIDAGQIAAFTAVRLLERWAEYAAHLRRTQPSVAIFALPVVANPYFRQQLIAAPERVNRLLG